MVDDATARYQPVLDDLAALYVVDVALKALQSGAVNLDAEHSALTPLTPSTA